MSDEFLEMLNLTIQVMPIGLALVLIAKVGYFIYDVFQPDPTDAEFEEKAKNGTAIILTYEQYLALHEADPARYPLITKKLHQMLRSSQSKLHMNSDDFDKLYAFCYERDQSLTDAKARNECLEELQHMRSSLDALIEKQEAENWKTAQKVTEQTIQLVQAEGLAATQKTECGGV